MTDLNLSNSAKVAWQDFLSNQENFGHVERVLDGKDINSHVNKAMNSARATVTRIKSDIGNFSPRVILEIGCSTGLNCLALQEAFPDSEVIGLEPEQQALYAAECMRDGWAGRWPQFIHGYGESIPLLDQSVDLIVCHTVIEHVQNVSQLISEVARTLSESGFVHLEAPNYLWFYEPHLQIWTIPKLGKSFVKLSARLQAKGSNVLFLDHLKFVTPFELESLFIKNRLAWHNRTEDKILATLYGSSEIKKYTKISKLISILGRLPMSGLLGRLMIKSRLYPSLLYTLRNASKNERN